MIAFIDVVDDDEIATSPTSKAVSLKAFSKYFAVGHAARRFCDFYRSPTFQDTPDAGRFMRYRRHMADAPARAISRCAEVPMATYGQRTCTPRRPTRRAILIITPPRKRFYGIA